RRLLFVFFLFAASTAQAADIQVETRAWPTKVMLGDEIKLSIKVDHPSGWTVPSPSPKTNVAPFEIKRVEPRAAIQRGNRTEQTFVVVLTVFELGDLQVPAFPFNYKDSSGRTGTAFTKSVKIKVVEVPKKPTDKGDIRPIKGPVSMSLMTLWTTIFSILAFCLAVFLAVKLYLRLRNRVPKDPDAHLPPPERALRELERLKKKGLIEAGKTKEFYSELSDILRRYYQRQFNFDTFEWTTFEFLRFLKEKEFEKPVLEKMKNVLESADLVKFAKFEPKPMLAEELAAEIRMIVDMTKPKEEVVKK
ncbi:MAG TPA: hypothetical protein VD883_00765, partial [Candidatus Omnitrophota bacterium]|nr:hypothetical protein [Candidatus Omnitrophota bacterium]